MVMKPTPRIERLRQAFFDLKPTVSIDRARIEARALRGTEGEPTISRRAKVFAAVVREMPIDIYPEELLVGYASVRRRCINVNPATYAPLLPEGASDGVRDTERPAADGLGDEDIRELAEDLIPYWKEQGRAGKYWNYGHNVHDLKKVVEKGFLGIEKEAGERLAELDRDDPLDLKKAPFLEGVAIAMQAAAGIGKRFAARARELAGGETNRPRKTELLRIAEVCDRVPANPARTFYEALQSYHFAWLLLVWEFGHSAAHSQGRIDQCLYPYYENDINAGRITPEEAQELLDCYILQLNNIGVIGPSDSPSAGGSIGVGGLRTDGNDATNALSYMLIEAIMHTRLVAPWFAVHIHSKTPDDLLIKACRLCSLGTGHPQFLNCDVGVAQALSRGSSGGVPITLEDARSISNVGALECVVPGKDSGYLYVGAGHNLALAMDLVLTNGVRRSDEERMGPETGDPRRFGSFEEVREAFCRQLAWMRSATQAATTPIEQSLMDLAPTVYESALIENCIEDGICKEAGGARYDYNIADVEHGSTDAGDSLAAIKKLVFDEKKVTMAELCDALDGNFDGFEEIRKMCLEVPKFGNDDDYVDEQVAWVLRQWSTEFRKLKNLRGRNACAGGSPLAAYIPKGMEVGALPSGRLAGEPLAPAACPGTGNDRKGVTAVFKSMGKVDGVQIPAGLSLTTRIDPAVFRTRDGVKRLADLMRVFIDQKIFHVQFNVVSSDTLKAAQREPEKYRDLTVKVAAYNAFFTELTRPVQDSIIARTEHGL